MKTINQQLVNSWPFLLGLVAGLYFVVFALTGMELTYFPGDMGDARFNAYVLEHGHLYLTGEESSLWNAPFMYPEPNIITYSDNLIGAVPFYSIFRFMGQSVLESFQSWFILLAILNYTSCYYFLRWLLKNRYAAVLGAFIFAFSLALQSQMTHAQMFPRFFIPLAIWMILKFREDLNPRFFFWGLFFVVAQFYAGIYLGFMLSIPFAILFLGILFFSARKEFFARIKQFKWIGLMVAATIINCILLMQLMYPYYQRSLELGENSYANILHSVPTIKSFFYSQPGSLLWDSLSQVGSSYPASWDHQLFPGLLASLTFLAFILIIVFKRSWLKSTTLLKGNAVLIGISAILTFLFFTRFQGFSMYKFIHDLPGFGSMRSLTRIINVELFFFGVGLAIVALLLFTKFKERAGIIFAALLGLLVIDNYFDTNKSYRTEVSVAQKRIDNLKLKMEGIPKGEVISYEPDEITEAPHVYQLDAMHATQSMRLKCLNGYSGSSPIGFDPYWHNMNEETRISWLKTSEITGDKIHVIH